MSRITPALAALVALACAAAPVAAQEDTGMTAHDPGMMAHDSAMMDHGGAMDDKMKDHDKMMHDGRAAMEADRMFVAAGDAKASGEYEIVEADGKRKLRLTPDFAVPGARDLYLVLAAGDEPADGALYLGRLSRPAGEQAFELPKGKALGGYTRLLVWSKQEKRAVASAPWQPVGGHAMDKM
ncbi:MAG TPA: DM13 domain-containing protein [Gemmatimonadales bacterium]|nr:DM13 domain-containing protein [Gemmatimonadales bacterium]